MKYRFDMITAYREGETRHPQIAIFAIAPAARAFVPCGPGDCWLFETDKPIANPPSWVTEIARNRVEGGR